MKKIKIYTTVLLAKIKENREKHNSLYQSAMIGYKEKLIATLEKMLSDAKEGKQIEKYIGLSEPIHNLKDYDRAIAMLETTLDTVIELDQEDFDNYFLDEWGWKEQFIQLNSSYVMKK